MHRAQSTPATLPAIPSPTHSALPGTSTSVQCEVFPWRRLACVLQQHQSESDGSGKCLYPKNLRIRCDRTEYTGESYAREKENLDRVAIDTEGQAPDQPGS